MDCRYVTVWIVLCTRDTAVSFRTSENWVPSVLTVAAQANPYAQKLKQLQEVYRATGSE
jgi:hypothetical protein